MEAFVFNYLACYHQPNQKNCSIRKNHVVQMKIGLKMSSNENFSKKIKILPNPFQKKENFFKLNISVEEVIKKLQNIQSKEDFLNFCYINRGNLSYDLLYRLTVLKLRNENNQERINQIQKVEIFRKKILESTLVSDQAVAQSLILGEKRIKEILNKSNDSEIVRKNIGENRISVSCFWVVLFASLIAWEKRISKEGQIDSNETYQKLLSIKSIFKESEKHQKLLANELKVIQGELIKDKKEKISTEIDIDSINGLKLLISQLEKLPSSSYGPLLTKVSKIYDEVVFQTYGIKSKGLHEQYSPFTPIPIKTKSRLVEIQQTN